MSIVMSALILSSNVPVAYCAMLSVPDIAVKNVTACRVFRDVKLGLIKDDTGTNNANTVIPNRLRLGPTIEVSKLDKLRTRQINVEITRMTTIAPPFPDEFA